MLLMEIRDYIESHEQASLQELANRFNIPTSAMQDMVKRWVKKGVVTEVAASSCSTGGCSTGSCGGCPSVKIDDTPQTMFFWGHK